MPQRAYRFRFYPKPEQRQTLARMFGTARWVWNQCLVLVPTIFRHEFEASGDSFEE